MSLLAFALIAASAWTDEPNPAELVGLLASSDRIVREEAARTLEELGPSALPSLRLAESDRGNPSRPLVRSLARLIEGRMLEQPTLVAVDFDGLPIEEVVAMLAKRSGHALEIDAGDDPTLVRRPIMAKAPTPLPFWEALDAIGRAGQVRHDPGASPWVGSIPPLLHLASGEPPQGTLYRGPFRLQVVGVHRRRDLDLGTGFDRRPGTRGVLYLDLQAFVEPGRFIDFDGLPRFEAIDDLGHAFPAAPPDDDRSTQNNRGWQVPGSIGLIQWPLPLGLPGPEVSKIRKIRGIARVIVSARRPESLVVALDDPPGKSYRFEETTLRFRIVSESDRSMQVEVMLKQEPGPTASRDEQVRSLLYRRFSFEDRAGRPLNWLPSFENVGPDKQTRFQMMISEGERPIRLRFHDVVWTKAQIPFDFTDIPLP